MSGIEPTHCIFCFHSLTVGPADVCSEVRSGWDATCAPAPVVCFCGVALTGGLTGDGVGRLLWEVGGRVEEAEANLVGARPCELVEAETGAEPEAEGLEGTTPLVPGGA